VVLSIVSKEQPLKLNTGFHKLFVIVCGANVRTCSISLFTTVTKAIQLNVCGIGTYEVC
jgi:hypothetical protein